MRRRAVTTEATEEGMNVQEAKVIKRTTRVVVETQQLLVIKRQVFPARAWCPACAREVQMITPEEAAIILQRSTRTIYLWVEAAQIHFREQPLGSLLICLDSLPAD